jgi:23S rRNA (cytidine1920-2'-O)/16S rRNA (cytidine1409-2'-O)-methyltransferase
VKKRIDILLVERGLVATRSKAQALIMSGNVLVNDVPVTKAGEPVLDAEETLIRVRGSEHPYVSRGAIKLAKAIELFKVGVQGRIGLDIGASTGGFTEVLLLNGAEKVFAVDVGHNQMDWKIRNDPKVVCLEKINAREIRFEQIGQKVGLIVMDVSFISIEKILPALLQFSTEETDWITLIKPQFEVGKDKVGKGGIVTSENDRNEVVERITLFGETLGLKRLNLIESPITGTDGNKEFLAHWKLKVSPN